MTDALTIATSTAVVAAIITAATGLRLATKRTREDDKARVRTAYAEAFEAVAAYKELPYAIRRRNIREPETERARLSAEARAIQQRLSYYRAWTRSESALVGQAYEDLVTHLRATAGKACHDAWANPPITNDAGMNIDRSKVDLNDLDAHEDVFIFAVAQDLAERTGWRIPGWRIFTRMRNSVSPLRHASH